MKSVYMNVDIRTEGICKNRGGLTNAVRRIGVESLL